MKLTIQTPQKALKAFIKQRPLRSDIDKFKFNLIGLLDKIKTIESLPKDETEEHLKNNVRDFLRDTYYKETNEINTKDKKDLVIHLGNKTDSAVGVIIEAKRPSNEGEMMTIAKPNNKALWELILYYFDERVKANNNELKQLVVTNIYQWYLIDANYFDKYIYRNSAIKKLYEIKQHDKKDNPWFYEELNKSLATLELDIPCVGFDIRTYDDILRNNNIDDDKALISLYKILSPQHLLKQVTPNDGNSLNAAFYKELLHIIGLEEAKDGGKNIIRRKLVDKNEASLIEATIEALKTEDVLHRIPDVSIYGTNKDERIFNISLELCITWINRILFLKLLEGQLINYHKGDKEYRFLNNETIHDYDELFKLFHKVLAVNMDDRSESLKTKYSRVPYLNSSLFEISELEDQTIKINSLDNTAQLDLISSTVLKDLKKKTNKLPTLNYLQQFLDAYDFASEGTEDVQEDNKTIITASVLGKVFEKINGYKDGSVFTPSFITMYMCRKSIRLSVVQKFKDYFTDSSLQGTKQSQTIDTNNINSIDEIKELITNKIISREAANEIINSLKICDPAVGSGHFLVSALNEVIVIKSELNVLLDEFGKTLRDYEIEIINDELIITDENGTLFAYNPLNKESNRVQKTLFQEKQIIIENCLFGVDINPNSVKICRLRLWIELLKNAYYRSDLTGFKNLSGLRELETLPNIDINIKCGNSLISRFALDADLSKALKSIKYDINSYRGFVQSYKNEKSRDAKRGLLKIIDSIKSDFRTEISKQDPIQLKVNKASGELLTLLSQTSLLELSAKDKKAKKEKQNKLEEVITKLNTEIDEIKNNAIYKNAFEWRFEFPEVLSNKGEYLGFDLVIGNPPYISITTNDKLKVLSESYETYSQTGDIYSLFYELANNIQKTNGIQALIISNKWMRANYGLNMRKYILEKSNPLLLIDFGQNLIFDNAIVHTNIIISQRNKNLNMLNGVRFKDNQFFKHVNNFGVYVEKNKIDSIKFGEGPWNILVEKVDSLKQKIELNAKPLKDWDIKINFGIKTGLNEAFIIDKATRDKLVELDVSNNYFIKPILRGRDTRKYFADFKDFYLINIQKGYTIKSNISNSNIVMEPPPRYGEMEFDEAWEWFYKNHNAIAKYLFSFKTKAEKREDKGDYWWELRACAYIGLFEKPKIIFSEIVSEPQFYYDEKGYYPEATVFFISGNNLKYLTALLNSKPVTFFFKSFYMGGELVGKIRYKKAFLEQIPIPIPTEKQEMEMNSLVDKIILQKQQNQDTKMLEAEIDQMVYKLYELTNEEIKIVEEA